METFKVRIFWPVFFAVLFALTVFGSCAGLVVTTMKIETISTVAGQRVCETSNIFGVVWSRGPCD